VLGVVLFSAAEEVLIQLKWTIRANVIVIFIGAAMSSARIVVIKLTRTFAKRLRTA
jgi:hypothetical protein